MRNKKLIAFQRGMKIDRREQAKSPIILVSKERVSGAIFTIQKFNADGVTYQGEPFHNLVLDVGLDSLAVRSLLNATAYCNVGTGNATPAVTDTGLGTFFAATNTLYGSTTFYGTASNPMYISVTRTWTFPIGTFSGQNIAELALSAGSNSDYYNRQLVKDGAGSPTTISPASDEGIRITAEIRIYSDLQVGATDSDSFAGSGLLLGDTFNYDRTANSNAYTYITSSTYDCNKITRAHFGNILAAITDSAGLSNLSGSGGIDNLHSSVELNTYTAGDYYRQATCKWDAENFEGTVKYIGVGFNGSSGTLQRMESIFELTGDEESPEVLLEKTSLQELTLVFRREWGRY